MVMVAGPKVNDISRSEFLQAVNWSAWFFVRIFLEAGLPSAPFAFNCPDVHTFILTDSMMTSYIIWFGSLRNLFRRRYILWADGKCSNMKSHRVSRAPGDLWLATGRFFQKNLIVVKMITTFCRKNIKSSFLSCLVMDLLGWCSLRRTSGAVVVLVGFMVVVGATVVVVLVNFAVVVDVVVGAVVVVFVVVVAVVVVTVVLGSVVVSFGLTAVSTLK